MLLAFFVSGQNTQQKQDGGRRGRVGGSKVEGLCKEGQGSRESRLETEVGTNFKACHTALFLQGRSHVPESTTQKSSVLNVLICVQFTLNRNFKAVGLILYSALWL